MGVLGASWSLLAASWRILGSLGKRCETAATRQDDIKHITTRFFVEIKLSVPLAYFIFLFFLWRSSTVGHNTFNCRHQYDAHSVGPAMNSLAISLLASV